MDKQFIPPASGVKSELILSICSLDCDPDPDFEKSQFAIQGSMAYRGRLTPKYENKKEGFQRYLKYSFNSILNIIPRSRYRALDLNKAKKRIHNTTYTSIHFLDPGGCV